MCTLLCSCTTYIYDYRLNGTPAIWVMGQKLMHLRMQTMRHCRIAGGHCVETCHKRIPGRKCHCSRTDGTIVMHQSHAMVPDLLRCSTPFVWHID